MNTEHLVYIPKRAKIIITALAVVVFFLSIAIVSYSLIKKVDTSIITTSLTLAQTCVAGLSVIALIFYTKFNVSVKFLKERTASFLMTELPEAMLLIDYEDHEFEALNANYRPPDVKSNTKISIRYDKGAHYCQYKVLAYGNEQRIYVQVNVKRMVVSYFIDGHPSDRSEVQGRLEYVVKAAETAGYSHQYEEVTDSADGSVTSQLRLFRSLSDEFLMNSGERLFIANDFASMTRAFVRALPR